MAEFFGAHRVSQKQEQERDRALLRTVISLGLALWWGAQFLLGRTTPVDPWFVAACILYAGVALFYRHVVHKEGDLFALYCVPDP